MYLDFYNLQKSPFHITPDPEFLFLSPSHKDALGTIIYGIEERKGFVAIIGEVGLGKTTILRSYLERVDPKEVKAIYIFNPNVSFGELIRMIYWEFGLEPESDDLLELVNHLYQILLSEYHAGRNVVLVIDEAQNMPVETLENLRMLSNLETATQKLLQILLVGQPEFEQKLNLHALRQLRQRIAIRARILPLTAAESMAYIHHRIAKVSVKRVQIFTTGALKRIVKQAKGVPRILNILCDNALIAGFGYQQKPVTAKIVKEVIADFEEKKAHPILRWGLTGAIGLALGMGLFWFSPYKAPVLAKVQNLEFPSVTNLLSLPFAQDTESPASAVLARDEESTPSSGPTSGPKEEHEEKSSLPVLTAPALSTSPGKPEQSGGPSAKTLTPEPSLQAPLPPAELTNQQTERNPPPVEQPNARLENQDRAETKPVSAQENPPQERSENAKVIAQTQAPALSVTRTVREGDYLSTLASQEYGFVNKMVLEWIQKHNPHIQDVNRITVGERILFPPLPPDIGPNENRR